MKLLIVFAIALSATLAHAATVTLSVPLSVPDGCVLNTAGTALTGCPTGTPTPPVDPGPGPTPTPGAISCPGFSDTKVVDLNWSSPGRVDTGPMASTVAVVGRFHTGKTASATNNLPRVTAYEFGSSPSTRSAVLSLKPCDWGPQPYPLASSIGTSVFVPFTVANTENWGLYPILNADSTYYFNVDSRSGTCGDNCRMGVELSVPGNIRSLISDPINDAVVATGKAYAAARAKMQAVALPKDIAAKRAKKVKATK